MIESAASPHLIAELDAPAKAQLPVSVAPSADGTQIIVSRYEDDVWDFWPYISQENLGRAMKRIDWRVRLPDQSRLTDPQHASLLESAKDFIWSLVNEPIEGRQRPSMTTLRGKHKELKALLRWMVGAGMNQFAQLNNRTLDYVPVAKRGAKGPLVPKKVWLRLSLLEDLYAQRGKLNDALTTHPWPHDSAGSLSGCDQKGGRKPTTPRIPESVVQLLATKALDYVQHRAEALLDARDVVTQAVAAAEKTNTPKSLSALRTKVSRESGFSGARELGLELQRLRTACFIVVGLFSGARISELLALSRSCVSHEVGLDRVDLVWMHGQIYKTGKPAHRWLVPPVVETALTVMERYSKPYQTKLLVEGETILRRLAEPNVEKKELQRLTHRLDVVRSHAEKLFLGFYSNEHTVQVLSAVRMNEHLKVFCKDFDICDDDGRPWSVHAHQFRRTYAYFVASAELGDLQYLREHFGHWSLDMTLLYADEAPDEYAADGDLLTDILAMKSEKQESVLRTYLIEDVSLANDDVMLADLRRTVRTEKNKDEFMRLIAGNVVLNGTGHSWCMGNARGTGCGGLCVFEADMCVDCRYGFIGAEHLPVWRGIAEQQEAALKVSDLGQPGMARAERILATARKVIRKLEEPE